MNTTIPTSLALLTLAVAPAACTTEDLHQDVLVADLFDGSNASPETTPIALYLSRTDLIDANDASRNLSSYRLRVDGRFVVSGDGDYIRFLDGSSSFVTALLPAGPHVLEVVAEDGRAAITTPELSLPAGVMHHLVMFGDPASLQFRFFADDPATVPAGARHLRLLNALDHGQPIQALRCPGSELPCGSFGTPIAFGEILELDEPIPTLNELRWSTAETATDGGSQLAASANSSWPSPEAPHFPFSLMIPLHIGAATGGCPGCVWGQTSWW